MEKIKFKRNRKKIFPRTIVVKISEESYSNAINLTKKLKISKSDAFRKIIDIGIKNS